MSAAEALQVILGEWPDIEPLLTVSELNALTSVSPESPGGPERLAAVFGIIAAALPADHAAWRAFGARFDPGSRQALGRPLDVALIELAGAALASPSSADDAAADALAEESRSALLRQSTVRASGVDTADSGTWLALPDGRELRYPVFQFQFTEPYRAYGIVGRLRRQLGADDDPWGAVAWWVTPNPWLSARPADLLGTAREPEIGYAADQLANDSW